MKKTDRKIEITKKMMAEMDHRNEVEAQADKVIREGTYREVTELLDPIIADLRAEPKAIWASGEEQPRNIKRFKIGTELVVSGLYSGDYIETIVKRTETEVFGLEAMYPNGGLNRHKIEIDQKTGSERFLSWEHNGEKSYVYPDSTPEKVYGRERNTGMTVGEILGLGLIDDNAKVCIRDSKKHMCAYGNWYQDDVLEYSEHIAWRFTWQDGGKLYIDLK